jgi:hypothetical protein
MAVHSTGCPLGHRQSFSFRIVRAGIVVFISLLAYPFLPLCSAYRAVATADSIGLQEKALESLVPGKPSERELAGGGSYSYSIALEAGQYLEVVVDQRGIDVIVALVAPDGKKIIDVDSPNGTHGPEPLFVIVDTAGDYRLDVRSVDKKAPAGRYEVSIVKLGTPTAEDRTRANAQLRFSEARSASRARDRRRVAAGYCQVRRVARIVAHCRR